MSFPRRHAAYYPLCDYSPELAAIRAAAAGRRGSAVHRLDVSRDGHERAKARRRTGSAVCSKSGIYSIAGSCRRHVAARACATHDELWDHLYEVDHQHVDVATFVRNVLAYCALARHDFTPEMLAADGSAAREGRHGGGDRRDAGKSRRRHGWVSYRRLAGNASPRRPAPVKAAAADAQVVLMRYGFEQLDRLERLCQRDSVSGILSAAMGRS